ncbi:MAG: (deoxy)nucleoside triphosphate pyrophosphohydrolase [Clostridiales Family XIII bacterium]|jgi:8-oxo-dGTP diphosphatase|nr:(deoxy)nucleoside triphosphate pyrophosphohydrolase [Clostridiales Family XIII bacterium]
MTISQTKTDAPNSNAESTIPPKPAIQVVAAIILSDGKLFATQRGYGDYKGWWEFPGGKVEAGEEDVSALKREIREELDANIEVDYYLQTIEYEYEKFYLTMRCYVCSLNSDRVSLLEHMDARWLGKDDICEVKWLVADLPVVEAICEQGLIV